MFVYIHKKCSSFSDWMVLRALLTHQWIKRKAVSWVNDHEMKNRGKGNCKNLKILRKKGALLVK